jgi:cytoskeletal protein RodZ
LLVIAAALIGGLAAAALVHASLVIAVVVSLVIGAIGVLVLFRSPARSPEPSAPHPATMPHAQPNPAGPPRAAPPPESYPPDPVAPATPGPAPAGLNHGGAPAVNETVVQLLPLTPPGTAGPADAPWWDSAQPAPAPSAGAKRAPAPDLSTYLASTFIAQCPRCGAFRLDIRRARRAWDFRCEVCEHTWSWQPGTPWPPVRVMPP